MGLAHPTIRGLQPRYSTFSSVYKLRWSDILRCRSRAMFTECEICQTLKADLSNKGLTFDQKLGAVQMYRKHLYDQFCDRSICWQLQAASPERSTALTIALDGLDQSKFGLPHDPSLQCSAALSLDWCYDLALSLFLFRIYLRDPQ